MGLIAGGTTDLANGGGIDGGPTAVGPFPSATDPSTDMSHYPFESGPDDAGPDVPKFRRSGPK